MSDNITEQIGHIPDGYFYLVSYGSNGPEQLAERLNNNINNNLETTIKNNSYPALIPKMKRGFFSNSTNWNGAVATLRDTNDGYVAGIALKITKLNDVFKVGELTVNFRNLMEKEAVNTGKYELKKLGTLKLTDQIVTNGYAFIGNLNFNNAETIKSPSIEYLEAIAKMLKYRRILANKNTNDDIEIDVSLYQGNRWNYKAKISFNINSLQ